MTIVKLPRQREAAKRIIVTLDRHRNTVSALSIIAGVSIWIISKVAF